MPWWGWMITGAALLGSELLLVDAEFYLVFLGLSALLVGVFGLAGPELPVWGQWLAFGGLSLVAMVGFRRRLYAKLRPPVQGFENPLTGETGVASEMLAPGARGNVEVRGARWTARNVGESAIAPGSAVRVQAVDSLELQVVADL